ncbi:hypothetical protein [Mycobacterium lepromatosis]|uniref:hypothetical protein n=1 Tax=Mycobacterium lepromatosis TaxID=480418 RepID=UPI000B241A1E|nr:hypothetical protein [Mycobacterium lepromatosis]
MARTESPYRGVQRHRQCRGSLTGVRAGGTVAIAMASGKDKYDHYRRYRYLTAGFDTGRLHKLRSNDAHLGSLVLMVITLLTNVAARGLVRRELNTPLPVGRGI